MNDKTAYPFLQMCLTAILACNFAALSVNAQNPKKGGLKWRVQQLHKDNNEGLDLGDINGDGTLDISAGEYWYAGPDFKPYPLRKLTPHGKDYLQNNGEHLYDIDGDGLLDVVSGRFTETRVFWYKNPGPGNYDKVEGWEEHILMDTGTGQNEVSFFQDIDGDGKPEWIENSWNDDNPLLIWRMEGRTESGAPKMRKHVVAENVNGHGMGFGDINSDSREDIVFKQGWFEHPQASYASPWPHHPDFLLPHACCPMIVTDLNRDGRNDIIWADGHNYGIYWEEQQEPQSNGATTWRQHLIDKKLSQAHALAWVDIDNDGDPELVTGKRHYAHSGRDPGADDPNQVVYYDFNQATLRFSKHIIAQGPSGKGPGIGLQIRIADLDQNGWKDIIVPGKSGTHILWNDGPRGRK